MRKKPRISLDYRADLRDRRAEKAHLYVMESAGFIKIGVATNPALRRAEMQTGNPHPIRIFHTIELRARWRAYVAENATHMALKEHRGGGGKEWFRCSEKDAISAMKLAIKVADDIF